MCSSRGSVLGVLGWLTSRHANLIYQIRPTEELLELKNIMQHVTWHSPMQRISWTNDDLIRFAKVKVTPDELHS